MVPRPRTPAVLIGTTGTFFGAFTLPTTVATALGGVVVATALPTTVAIVSVVVVGIGASAVGTVTSSVPVVIPIFAPGTLLPFFAPVALFAAFVRGGKEETDFSYVLFVSGSWERGR